jgi:2-methylcitrate dehydratase PrpD
MVALVNGASSHVVEQDDLHNSSMMHPVSWLPTEYSIISPNPYTI